MSKTIGRADDPDFVQDLEIVVSKQPGCGAAIGRIINRAGRTHQEIADHVKCDRSTVSHWLREERWPKPQMLLETLSFLNIDRALLNDASKVLLGGEILGDAFHKYGAFNTFNVTEEQLIQLIKEQDDFNQRDVLFRILWPVIVMRQGLRAAGLKGGENADPKAAKWISEERDKHLSEAQRRGQGLSRMNASGQSSSVARFASQVRPADDAHDQWPATEDMDSGS